MKNFWRAWAVWLPLLIFIGIGMIFARVLLSESEITPTICKPMPAFKLASLTEPEKFYTEQDWLGGITIVNFWATWCPPCRQEHPVLVKIAQDYPVRILGVNYKDQTENAFMWLQDFGNPYQMTLADPNGRMGIDWGVIAIPETFLVDAQGMIRYKHAGPITTKIWEEEIWPLICRESKTCAVKTS